MQEKLIIFILHHLLTILENSYLGNYWALKNGSPFIFYHMDIEIRCLYLYFHFLQFLPSFLMLNIWRDFLYCSVIISHSLDYSQDLTKVNRAQWKRQTARTAFITCFSSTTTPQLSNVQYLRKNKEQVTLQLIEQLQPLTPHVFTQSHPPHPRKCASEHLSQIMFDFKCMLCKLWKLMNEDAISSTIN